MADVIMGDALDIAQAHGQHRLGAVQGLNLALFIDAKYQGMVGRIQVKADDVPHLFDEERIGGEFEATTSVRRYGKRLKHTMHGGFGNAAVVGGLANTPMGSTGRLAGEGAFEQDGNLLIGNAAEAATHRTDPPHAVAGNAVATCPPWPWPSPNAQQSGYCSGPGPTTALLERERRGHAAANAKPPDSSVVCVRPQSDRGWVWGVR